MLTFIPSPDRGVVEIGPIDLHAYGLMLAIGVLVAAWIGDRRYRARGGEPGTIADIGLIVVVAGVVGARVYHLFTGYDWDAEGLGGTYKIWNGGLSIWGAVAGGALGVLWVSRRRGLRTSVLMDCLAPGVVVAQAIGRWGNWFNQELFGRPTTLPWGLEIDPAKRPEGYEQYATFHPTFLYESLYCLAVFAVLVGVERRFRLRNGQTAFLYVALYTFGRFWFELLRVDPAPEILGVRVNVFVSAVLCVGGWLGFVAAGRRGALQPQWALADGPAAEPSDAEAQPQSEPGGEPGGEPGEHAGPQSGPEGPEHAEAHAGADPDGRSGASGSSGSSDHAERG